METEMFLGIAGAYVLLLLVVIHNFFESKKTNRILNELRQVITRDDKILELVGDILVKAAAVEEKEEEAPPEDWEDEPGTRPAPDHGAVVNTHQE